LKFSSNIIPTSKGFFGGLKREKFISKARSP
jgi:hypothetical protein